MWPLNLGIVWVIFTYSCEQHSHKARHSQLYCQFLGFFCINYLLECTFFPRFFLSKFPDTSIYPISHCFSKAVEVKALGRPVHDRCCVFFYPGILVLYCSVFGIIVILKIEAVVNLMLPRWWIQIWSYFSEFVIPSILTSFPTPLGEMKP